MDQTNTMDPSYLNVSYPNTLIIQMPKMNVLLVFSLVALYDCFIRVIEQSSVYKPVGFSYLNNFT